MGLSAISFAQGPEEPAEETPQINFTLQDIIKTPPEITKKEWEQIKAGKILVRENKDGSLGGLGFTWAKVQPKTVYQVATRYNQYTKFIPESKKVEANQLNENTYEVYAVYKSTWPFDDIFIDSINLHDPKNLRMAWRATRTNMKHGEGFWIIQPQDGGTLIFYQMSFDLNWIPRMIARPSSKERVYKVLEAVRDKSLNATP